MCPHEELQAGPPSLATQHGHEDSALCFLTNIVRRDIQTAGERCQARPVLPEKMLQHRLDIMQNPDILKT